MAEQLTPEPTNTTNTSAPVSKAPPLAPKRYGLIRRVLRAVFWSALLTFSTVALLLFAALSWFNSSTGRYWLVDAINRSQVMHIAAIDGSFWSELQIKQFNIKTSAMSVTLDYGVLRWEPYLLMVRDLSLPVVSLGELVINTPPSPPDQPPSPPPSSLSLPFGIHLDELTIAKLRINGTELNDIAANISSNGRFHRLHLKQLRLPQGNLAAALNITGKAPFISAGSFIFSGQLEGKDIRAFGKVEGPLRQLQIEATAEHATLQGRAQLQADLFAPYAYQMVQHGQLELNGLNPQQWHSAAPNALLNMKANFTPTKDGLRGQIKVSNHNPGAVDVHKIPVQTTALDFALQGERFSISRWETQFAGQARLSAQGWVEQGQLKLNLNAEHLDPKHFWSPQPSGDMSGQVVLNGPWLSPGIKGQISDLQRKANLTLDLAWINPAKERRLAIREARLQRGSSTLHAKGEFNLGGKNDFSADLQLQNVNPAEFAAIPRGSIAGKINVKGSLQPKPQLDLRYVFDDSQFNGQALAGAGQLKLDAQRLSQSEFWLSLGANKLSANGSLGGRSDSLNLALQMPNLAQIGPQFRGKLSGSATLSGAMTQPHIRANLEIEQLDTPFDLRLNHGHINAAISSDLSGPVLLEAQLQKLTLGQTVLDSLILQAQGSVQAHELTLVAQGLHEQWPLKVDLRAKGGLNAQQVWTGVVQSLAGQAVVPFKLLNAPQIKVGSQQFDLGASNLQLGQSQLQLSTTRWQPGLLETQGQIQRLAVAEWLAVAKVANPSSDLVLAGEWNLRQSAVLNGDFKLNRVSGDVQWKDEALKAQPLTLSKLNLSGQFAMNRFAMQSQLLSQQFGQLAVSGDTLLDLARGGMADNAPLNLAMKGSLPNLAVFAPFLGRDVKLSGKAELDVKRAGPLKAPQMSGYLRASDLGYSDSNTGVKLQDGLLDIAMSNQQITLQTFRARGVAGGEISGSGALDFSNGKANGSLNLLAKRFTLVSKPDMLLVVSGQGAMAFKDNDLAVTGAFKADSGDIQFQANDVPSLSNDVIVLGREKKEAKPLTMKLHMQLDIDLGDNLMFRGYGLESRLAGKIRLRATPNMLLAASGTINTEEGEYKAYGQKLEIERGVLSFQGPIDNPKLDILAIRRNQAVEAGVQVKGSAYSPQVSLYSDPNVPDAEKISWLLFGHGADSMEKSDGALALQLLNSLAANGGNGQGLTDEIFGNLGIDEVGYKSKEEANGTTTQVVTVSKRLTKSLRVALEKSFNGLSDAVNFTLQLSRNWSVVSRIGVDQSSVDVKYTLSFD
ncbi:translocation/assembly module TamB domain-containing protein [Chitinibacter fontanus]|uniref:Translocation/assembly module TamB domain-containing protein n=1 Tax=Chitinibacter fontanus TaxID=1737446 RepID=A0A7D5Z1W8_9NEIS|nr:translocation/assembly module TamB domain-containing protein [Chitinibacter fontanus]QLI80063.1 translocation/assembly module TamB domain-containing protein [Chitinibacter fontanus]